MSCPWGDGRGRHVKGVSGCGCPDDPARGKGGADRNDIDQQAGRCNECGSKIDTGKRDNGHRRGCKVYAAQIKSGAVLPGKPPVKIPAHNGDWKKAGVMRNEIGNLVDNWQCRTCKRTAMTPRGSGPPGSRCPEIRGR